MVDPRELFMIGSNLTRPGMVGGLALRVGPPAAVLSDTFIVGTCAQSARKTFVLVQGPFLGTWRRRVLGLLKKKGYSAYPLTLGYLGERSHLLSRDRNFGPQINDISNVVGWQRARPFRRVQARVREVRNASFFRGTLGESHNCALMPRLPINGQ
jgi:hypothetical protein